MLCSIQELCSTRKLWSRFLHLGRSGWSPLPHPSPRNQARFKKNAQFGEQAWERKLSPSVPRRSIHLLRPRLMPAHFRDPGTEYQFGERSYWPIKASCLPDSGEIQLVEAATLRIAVHQALDGV